MTFDFDLIPAEDRQRLAKIGQLAYTTLQGLELTYTLARDVIRRGVPGAMVECGVANGVQLGAMLLAQDRLGERRPVHGFDSFEGIPLCGGRDGQQPGIGRPTHDVTAPVAERLVSSGVSVASEESVIKNLRSWGFDPGRAELHRGWFQNTVHGFDRPIALLRLDGDLYESTKVCLEHLYDWVAPGGWVIADDYGTCEGCRAAVDEFLPGVEMFAPTDYGAACFKR